MDEFLNLELDQLVELANKVGVSTKGSEKRIRANLLNDVKFLP